MTRRRKQRSRKAGPRVQAGTGDGPWPPEDDPTLLGSAILRFLALEDDCPAEEAAAFITEFPLPALMASKVASVSSIERVRRVAEVALERAPWNQNALGFAAQVALVEGHIDRAAELMEQATAGGPLDPDLLETRAAVWAAAGRVVDAVKVVDRLCFDEPEHFVPQMLRAEVLAMIERRLAEPQEAPCSCGSGEPYEGCCRAAESDALWRFGNRAALDDLTAGLRSHVEDLAGFTTFIDQRWIEAQLRYRKSAEALWSSDPMLRRLWGAAVFGRVAGADDTWAVSHDGPVASDFAEREGVRGRFGGLIGAWLDGGRFGLWQVAHEQQGPGLLLADVLSGLEVYADVPARVRDRWEPWMVLAGTLVPDRGVWRLLKGVGELSPMDADSAMHALQELAGVTFAGGPDPSGAEIPPIPPSLLIEVAPKPSPAVIGALVDVGRSALPILVGSRRSPPKPEDATRPGEVLVWTRLAADDVPGLWAELAGRDDVHLSEGTLWWRDPDSFLFPWNEGFIWMNGDGLAVVGTCTEALEILLAAIRASWPSANEVEERCPVYLGLHAGWATPGEPGPGEPAPEAVALWQERWCDVRLFDLFSLTPREASASDHHRWHLELVLRELEYHASRLRAKGRPVPDLVALRRTLGLPRERLPWALPEVLRRGRGPG